MGIEGPAISIGEKILKSLGKLLKLFWFNKIQWKRAKRRLIELSDEKYHIDKGKIDKEIPIQEADLKEKAGLKGLRWSSGLARDLFELNLTSAKKKICARLTIDKQIIYSRKKISEKDTVFLYDRARESAIIERQALKQKLESIYKDCRADNLINVDKPKIDQEIDALLKELLTNLLIDKETLKKE